MGMTRRKSQNQQVLEALQKGDAITADVGTGSVQLCTPSCPHLRAEGAGSRHRHEHMTRTATRRSLSIGWHRDGRAAEQLEQVEKGTSSDTKIALTVEVQMHGACR